eukprot:1185239-Amphidinium_carterae.1
MLVPISASDWDPPCDHEARKSCSNCASTYDPRALEDIQRSTTPWPARCIEQVSRPLSLSRRPCTHVFSASMPGVVYNKRLCQLLEIEWMRCNVQTRVLKKSH